MKIYLSSLNTNSLEAYLEIFPDAKLNVLVSYGLRNKSVDAFLHEYASNINSIILDSGTYTMNWIASEDKEWAISAAALEPMGVSTFFLSCSSNNGFDQSEWIIGGIISDELDPQVINHNEEAVVCIQLNNQVFSNGFVEVSISNELGKSTTSSVTTGS